MTRETAPSYQEKVVEVNEDVAIKSAESEPTTTPQPMEEVRAATTARKERVARAVDMVRRMGGLQNFSRT